MSGGQESLGEFRVGDFTVLVTVHITNKGDDFVVGEGFADISEEVLKARREMMNKIKSIFFLNKLKTYKIKIMGIFM